MVSTPSSRKASRTAAEPVNSRTTGAGFFAAFDLGWVVALGVAVVLLIKILLKFVGNATFGCVLYLFCVFKQQALCGFQRGLFPGRLSFCQLFGAYFQGDGILYGVELDDVIVIYQADGAADMGFGGDMTDDEAVS